MNKQILASVAAAALLSVTGLNAAQAETSLAGTYAGAQAGYDIFGASDTNEEAKGIEGGLFMGYNYLVAEKFILGAEANFNLTDADNTVAGITTKVKNNYGLSARAGFLATDNAMVYVRGGYQRALFKITDGVVSDSKHFDGWNIGGGVEAAVADNISVRAEFVYTNYSASTEWDFNPDQKQINLGVAYHF